MSQDIENQQITSLKYTAITPRLRQNEQKRAFVAGNSVNALQVCSIALVLLFITTRDGTTGQETLLKHFGPHDVRQRRQDRTVKLLSCNYASGSSRN